MSKIQQDAPVLLEGEAEPGCWWRFGHRWTKWERVGTYFNELIQQRKCLKCGRAQRRKSG